MLLGRVLQPIHAAHKDASLEGRKLFLVQIVNAEGQPEGVPLIAVESPGIGSGPGDNVLVHREGGGARQMLGDENAPVNATICGLVDHVHLTK